MPPLSPSGPVFKGKKGGVSFFFNITQRCELYEHEEKRLLQRREAVLDAVVEDDLLDEREETEKNRQQNFPESDDHQETQGPHE